MPIPSKFHDFQQCILCLENLASVSGRLFVMQLAQLYL